MNELTELKLTFLKFKLMYKTGTFVFSHHGLFFLVIRIYLSEFGPVITDSCVSDLSILFKASISILSIKKSIGMCMSRYLVNGNAIHLHGIQLETAMETAQEIAHVL